MIRIRLIVDEIRKLTSFIRNSSKSSEKIKKLQETMSTKVLRVQNDVPTRWNSTLHMINRTSELHDPLNEFMSFYKSASGRKEFKFNNTELPDLTDKKWAILKGLSYLLTCFDKATVTLSGQKYSTFVSAIPVFRKLESYLSNQFMFKFDDVSKMAKTKNLYYELYGEMECFKRVVLNLDYARMLLLQEFQQRFSGLYDNFL